MAFPTHHVLPEKAYESYGSYLHVVGPSAIRVARALRPEEILAHVGASGLRGRGGAGFPTGRKWEAIAGHPCPTRYVVCNAAEGEPGTFKDRWLIRKNPYAVIEGLLVAAHAVSAKAAYIAVKRSFLPEMRSLKRALREMAEDLFLPVTIVTGPEEYLFGEEKALLNVMEGEGPFPRPVEQPPYEWGLFATEISANPTLVNNAETFAHVSTILRLGSESFRRLGTQDTPGTLIVTLSGAIRRPGVYEIPAGLPLRELLSDHGGGPLPGRSFKAVLSGVSSAPVLAKDFLTPCDFGSFQAIGSGLGSCGFVALDNATSAPRVAQAVARFLYVESCMQCSACKVGLGAASEAVDEMFSKKATPDDPEKAAIAARSAPQGNRCYLPVQGAALIPALLSAFKEEFDALIRAPGASSEDAWTLPKMTDFDEEKGVFLYDDRQRLKEPDWTYREETVRVRGNPRSTKRAFGGKQRRWPARGSS
ncbi:MAG TPA: NADH-ubiquinone oxidoreductase-F iron-sulfur binding region domain-containing protein [bacterium]|nr:NADH-ubiquinone oxidoreductase-F iron-sulfur binding region domain-containing protein [bacterium]